MSTDNVTRINEMEAILDECRQSIDELQEALDKIEQLRGKMGRLFSYYGSAAWYEDRELELPPDVKAGVLSEDLVYDVIMDTRDASFQMLELGTDILKNRI